MQIIIVTAQMIKKIGIHIKLNKKTKNKRSRSFSSLFFEDPLFLTTFILLSLYTYLACPLVHVVYYSICHIIVCLLIHYHPFSFFLSHLYFGTTLGLHSYVLVSSLFQSWVESPLFSCSCCLNPQPQTPFSPPFSLSAFSCTYSPSPFVD